jgi:acetoacetyl-CoA synthetase
MRSFDSLDEARVNPNFSPRTLEQLVSIWQRVLGLSSVHPDDNFFDAGGDPASSLRLFAEIAKTFGRQLPPLVIYQAPTPATLADLLEKPAPPRISPLMKLKSGSDAPPIFITHGLGGSVMELFHVVNHLDTRHPIYGMQARGSDGLEKPLSRIEDMAELFLDAIRRIQSRGPYLLIGYSLGGLIMFEMANRLSQSGDKVALLAMIDSYPSVPPLPVAKRLRLVNRQNRRHDLASQSSQNAQSSNSKVVAAACDCPQTSEIIPVSAYERLRENSSLALQRYQPRFYSGEIKFVRAEIISHFPPDPVPIWSPLSQVIEVVTVPGDHYGMIHQHPHALAAVLSRFLAEAR